MKRIKITSIQFTCQGAFEKALSQQLASTELVPCLFPSYPFSLTSSGCASRLQGSSARESEAEKSI